MQTECETREQSTPKKHGEGGIGTRMTQPTLEAALATMEALQADAPRMLVQILFNEPKERP